MRFNNEWKDYRVIATGSGNKLEVFGGITVLRPDPQIIWKEPFKLSEYNGIHATYERSKVGGGEWTYLKKVPEEFFVHWRNLKFSLKLMNFKHTGIFPEQSYNWERIIDLIEKANRPVSVLNLFAYTGGATLAAASAGAKVCHVDAAKAMCERAGRNAQLSGLDKCPIRYIVDDCFKFVQREIKRGVKYDAIIMDPPSFGRGPNGETWKLEDKIFELVELTKNILSDNPLFYLINSYTSGLQASVIGNILKVVFKDKKNTIDAYELGIMTETDSLVLPSGESAFMTF